MGRWACLILAALLVTGAACAQTNPDPKDDARPTGESATKPGTRASSGDGPYRSTGPGASLMVPSERRQMDECTKFATWDYCKRRMLGP